MKRFLKNVGAWIAAGALVIVCAPVAGCATGTGSGAGNVSATVAQASAVPVNPDAYERGELLVGVDDAGVAGDATTQRVRAELEGAGLSVVETLAEANEYAGSVLLARVDTDSADNDATGALQEAMGRAASIHGVAYVQPNYRYAAQSTEAQGAVADPDASKQWYLNSWNGDKNARGIDAVAAWKHIANPAAVDVAVLDTGLYSMRSQSPDDLHQEFDGSNVAFSDAVDLVHTASGSSPEKLVNSNNPYGDDNGHGTHVAALIAAKASLGSVGEPPVGVAGVAPGARIIPVKVLDGAGEGNSATFVKAYSYLLGNRASKFPNLHVINMSFSMTEESDDDLGGGLLENNGTNDSVELSGYGDYTGQFEVEEDSAESSGEDETDTAADTALGTQIAAAGHAGIVTVCAGGNDASTSETFPSDMDVDACVSVTALDANGGNAPYANYNEFKDLSAPGSNIYSAWATQADAYADQAGSSQAAALVSGVFALLWQANPQLTVPQAQRAVYGTAHAVTGGTQNITADADGEYNGSHGAVDAAAAVAWVQMGRPPRSLADDECAVSAIEGQNYTGKAVRPAFDVSYNGTVLIEGTDYKVTYLNNTAKGWRTAAVLLEGIGSYTGWRAVRFSIGEEDEGEGAESSSSSSVGNSKRNAGLGVSVTTSEYTASLAKSTYTYTGKKIKPKVTVVAGKKMLTQGTDYTVTYSKNKNPGTATATVRGIGAYKTTAKLKFKIKLGAARLKKVKAGKHAFTATWKRVKSGRPGYQVRYSTKKTMKGAKKRLIKKNARVKLKLKRAGTKRLKSGKRYYVQVRTFKKIGSKTYHGAWSAKKSVKPR